MSAAGITQRPAPSTAAQGAAAVAAAEGKSNSLLFLPVQEKSSIKQPQAAAVMLPSCDLAPYMRGNSQQARSCLNTAAVHHTGYMTRTCWHYTTYIRKYFTLRRQMQVN